MDPDRRKEIIATQKPEIPWANEPAMGSYYDEAEFEAVRKIMQECNHPHIGFNAHSQVSKDFEAAFADYIGVKHCRVVNGAGAGQDMAMMCFDFEPGDEVIVPAINFKACGLSAAGQGATVVWCEVDERTFQADPADIEARITKNTRCIYPVHMNGMAAPVDDYLALGEKYPHPKHGPIKVVGDTARALGAGYRGKKVGARAWITTFSFHTMKNMTTLGEGGAVVTNDDVVADRLTELRGFGGQGWGTNYKMTNVQCAVGLCQLEKLEGMLEARRRVAYERNDLLAGLEEVITPYVPEDCWHTYYLYTCLVPLEWAGEKRDRLQQLMKEDYGIPCVVANPPCYTHPWLAKVTDTTKTPKAEVLGKRLFCPPIHPLMSSSDNEYICAALWESVERIRNEG
ncbi:MAG TPA: DegT/DnrJ/EryC1/StrS family aminotransferase [Armatimonadota bacterium]|nr:DegT/DnrJ/EryC1/StrS family aminotransferase [Armatimonadota bacterium]